jgi:iron(III) transport system ATP-binding protein
MLKVNNIQCQYQGNVVLEDLSFHVKPGEICCLLGPSGCGKTTALRAIAGFHPVDQGEIRLNDQLLSSKTFRVDPELRKVGMVFQDYALFPHLNIRDNIRFGINKQSPAEQNKIIDGLLALVKLKDVGQRYPHELSGGQQQRVALARALAPNPQLLLLDEPFSNLDVDLRRHLNLEVREILKEYGIGAILVTHDQEEAFAFGDQIGLLHEGHLQQWDTPFNLFHEPQNRFVANFIGQGCLIPGLTIDDNTVKTELGMISGNRSYQWPPNTPIEVLLRPDDIEIDDEQGIPAEVVKKVFSGSATLYSLRLSTGSIVESMIPSHHDYQLGDQVNILPHIEHLIAFGPDE